jgi:hypothetical protein
MRWTWEISGTDEDLKCCRKINIKNACLFSNTRLAHKIESSEWGEGEWQMKMTMNDMYMIGRGHQVKLLDFYLLHARVSFVWLSNYERRLSHNKNCVSRKVFRRSLGKALDQQATPCNQLDWSGPHDHPGHCFLNATHVEHVSCEFLGRNRGFQYRVLHWIRFEVDRKSP